MYHSHSYVDPNTGEVIDVMIADPNDGPDLRNARDHRGDGAAPPGGQRPPGHAPWNPGHAGGRAPNRVVVRHPQTRPQAQPQAQPQTQPGSPNGAILATGEYIAIPKRAIAELVPALGQVWASFLGRPDAPQAIGDDVVDRNNAAMHRDALSSHAQNQTRILALSDLAARTLRLML